MGYKSPPPSDAPRTRTVAALDICENARTNVARLVERDPSSAMRIASGALDRIAELLRGQHG